MLVFSIILFAGVAERFRRLPAEQLYMGSTPIPGFSAYIYVLNVMLQCNHFLRSLKNSSLVKPACCMIESNVPFLMAS
jgi:hypothetical protein